MITSNRNDLHRQEATPEQGQYDLFAQRPTWSSDSPAGKFEAYHEANPAVFELLVREARRWMAEGRGKLGINLLVGRVRWVLTKLQTGPDADGFRINDHVAPYYARLLMHRCPDLDGLFDLRSSPDADAWIATYPEGQVA